MIHARYIITAHGFDAMYNKYAAKEFGTCPLIQCLGQPVLPVGLKDEVGADTVKVFCPKCQSAYQPPPSRSRGGSGAVDGASFGTTFPHMFLMKFSNLVPDGLPPESAYVPRVFGFRVHQSARQQGSISTATVAATNTKSARTSASLANVNVVATTPQDKGKSRVPGGNDNAVGSQHNTGAASFPQQQLVSAENGNAGPHNGMPSSINFRSDQNDGNNKRKVKGATTEPHVAGNGNGSSNGDNKLKRQKRPGNGIT